MFKIRHKGQDGYFLTKKEKKQLSEKVSLNDKLLREFIRNSHR